MLNLVHTLLASASATDGVAGIGDAIIGKVIGLFLWIVVPGLLLFVMIKAAKTRYKTVPPDKALVVYGGGATDIVTGGAKFVVPLLREFYTMDLTNFDVPLELKEVPNHDRIPITIDAFAICRLSSKKELLQVAARTFGRKDPREIASTVKNTLEGHLRNIVGQMTVDKLISERDEFNQKIQAGAQSELASIGCEIVIMNIKSIIDAHGIIIAKGRPEAARVLADADIQEALAKRESIMKISEAQKDGATLKATNDQAVADAQRALSIRQAEIKAEVNAAEARAGQAGPQAEAEASKGVLVAQVAAQEAKTIAETKLQDAVAAKTEATMKATVLKQAEAERERLSIEATGRGQARNIEANAAATASIKEAEGQAALIRTVGTAKAEMTAKNGQAEAEATQAKLEAEAAGQTAQAGARKALLLAEADGATAQANATKALLLAQADGALKLNEAYSKLSPEAQKLFIMKQLMETGPQLIAALGDAGAKITEHLAQAMVAAYSSVDNVTIYDSGGSGGGKGAMDRWVAGPGDFLFKLVTGLKQSGMLNVFSGMLKQATGLDLEQLVEGGVPAIDATAVALTGDAKGGNGPVTKKDSPAATVR